MARWAVYLRQSSRGWEWSRTPDQEASWWGFYKTEGHARSAAKRSIPKFIGKSNPADFLFITLTPKVTP